jgi:hypothetical protein
LEKDQFSFSNEKKADLFRIVGENADSGIPEEGFL